MSKSKGKQRKKLQNSGTIKDNTTKATKTKKIVFAEGYNTPAPEPYYDQECIIYNKNREGQQ